MEKTELKIDGTREREISYDDVALISLLNDPSSISFLPNYRLFVSYKRVILLS